LVSYCKVNKINLTINFVYYLVKILKQQLKTQLIYKTIQ